jgi:hypothetical protein
MNFLGREEWPDCYCFRSSKNDFNVANLSVVSSNQVFCLAIVDLQAYFVHALDVYLAPTDYVDIIGMTEY